MKKLALGLALAAGLTTPALAGEFATGPEAKAALTQIVEEYCNNPANADTCRSGPVHYWNPQDRSWTVGFGEAGVFDMIEVAMGGLGGEGGQRGGGGGGIGAALGNASRAIGGWLGSDPFGCGGCPLGNPVGTLPDNSGGVNAPGNGSPVGTGGGPGNPPGAGGGNLGAGTEDNGSGNPGADY